MGAQDEVGIFPSPLRALPQSWARSQTSDAERILLEHRIQPEICDSSCERTCCGEASGAARGGRRPRYGRPVLSILAADLGSGRISLVGAAEGLVARLDALHWQALPDAPGDRETAVGHERTANRPAPEGEQQRAERQRRRYGRTKPGSRLQHPIPVKSDRWDVNSPGFSEIDRVSHSGNSGEGEFAHSLNLTDIHSGWTESRALLGKSQVAVQQALEEIEKGVRCPLPGGE